MEIEERDGGIFVKEVQEHGCVAVHGKLAHLWCMVVDVKRGNHDLKNSLNLTAQNMHV